MSQTFLLLVLLILLLVLPANSILSAPPTPWRELIPESSTSGPAPRLGAVLASASGLYALHGGCSSSCCYAPLNDLWVLTPSSTWVNVSNQVSPPSGRLYHGTSPAASLNSSYVYGGTDVQSGCLDELYLLTLASTGTSSSPTATWVPVDSPQPHPAARSGHSQTALGGDGTFLVVGGEDDGGIMGDAWLFQPSPAAPASGTWSLVSNFSSSGPGPRVQHSALALALPRVGGGADTAPPTPILLLACGTDDQVDDTDDVWLLDMGATPPQWLLVGARPSDAPPASWPTPRHGHVAWGQQAQAQGGGQTQLSFFLFGGQSGQVPDPSQFLGDTWLFTVTVTAAQGGGGGWHWWEPWGPSPPSTPLWHPQQGPSQGWLLSNPPLS